MRLSRLESGRNPVRTDLHGLFRPWPYGRPFGQPTTLGLASGPIRIVPLSRPHGPRPWVPKRLPFTVLQHSVLSAKQKVPRHIRRPSACGGCLEPSALGWGLGGATPLPIRVLFTTCGPFLAVGFSKKYQRFCALQRQPRGTCTDFGVSHFSSTTFSPLRKGSRAGRAINDFGSN